MNNQLIISYHDLINIFRNPDCWEPEKRNNFKNCDPNIAEITFSFRCASINGRLAPLNEVDDPNCEVVTMYAVLGREIFNDEFVYGCDDPELQLSPLWDMVLFGSNKQLMWNDEPITEEQISDLIDEANLPNCLLKWEKMWKQVLNCHSKYFAKEFSKKDKATCRK